ncbi:MAG: ABC transporter permease [Firmicutes bacterium]|nr:ABC transporter permease [Bacillota bacterium]
MLAVQTSWGDLHFLSPDQVANAEQALSEHNLQTVPRVRVNVALQHELDQGFAMLIGLEPSSNQYQQAVSLDSGAYVARAGEIVLSSLLAESLDVGVGDQIEAATEHTTLPLTVVGVGDVDLLSLFGFAAVYSDIESARQLAGLAPETATDIIGFATTDNAGVVADLQAKLSGFTVSHWEDMGGFVKGGLSMYRAMFILFILVMMVIISILIINLIFMMGIERQQEIGTLRAIGYSKLQVVRIFLAEIISIAALACALGLAAGSALVLALSRVTIEAGPPIDFILGREFTIRYDISLIYPVAAVILIFTLVAALWPAWKASSLDPAETLKEQ